MRPIRINTNGHALLLYPKREVVDEIKEAGVKRLNVSLNAQNASVYNSVCRPKFENAFEKILEFVEKARDSDLCVEITAVTIPEVKVSEVKKIAENLGVGFRVRLYSPCIRYHSTRVIASFTFAFFHSSKVWFLYIGS